MHVLQSHEMIDLQWCIAEFKERSGVGRNRTVVNAVIQNIARDYAAWTATGTIIAIARFFVE